MRKIRKKNKGEEEGKRRFCGGSRVNQVLNLKRKKSGDGNLPAEGHPGIRSLLAWKRLKKGYTFHGKKKEILPKEKTRMWNIVRDSRRTSWLHYQRKGKRTREREIFCMGHWIRDEEAKEFKGRKSDPTSRPWEAIGTDTHRKKEKSVQTRAKKEGGGPGLFHWPTRTRGTGNTIGKGPTESLVLRANIRQNQLQIAIIKMYYMGGGELPYNFEHM